MDKNPDWRMVDVMSYFGEYVSEEVAAAVMRRVESFTGKRARFNVKMREFRNCLEYELKIDARYSAGYRRVK